MIEIPDLDGANDHDDDFVRYDYNQEGPDLSDTNYASNIPNMEPPGQSQPQGPGHDQYDLSTDNTSVNPSFPPSTSKASLPLTDNSYDINSQVIELDTAKALHVRQHSADEFNDETLKFKLQDPPRIREKHGEDYHQFQYHDQDDNQFQYPPQIQSHHHFPRLQWNIYTLFQ